MSDKRPYDFIKTDITEQIPGGFFIYKADDYQELIYANSAVYRIFGCHDANEFIELTGGTFRGMVHPDDFEKIQDSIDQQIADEENENLDYVEYRIIRKDGSIRWVDDYGHFAQMDGYGDVYYVFIGDITEKHYAQEESRRRANVYAGMLEQFNAFADDSLTVTRSNLTTGITEEVRGKDLYDVDRAGGLIAESARVRAESFLIEGDREKYEEAFRLDRLIERYYKGEGPVTFVGYCRRQSGRQCFVKFSGSAVIDPVSGDAIAFGVETEYNAEKVTEVLNAKVLAKQYDMVAYIVGDIYGVVIGSAENIKRGSIFPKAKDGVYTAYLTEQVLPAAGRAGHDEEEIGKALSPETIASMLEDNESYYVDVSCELGGEIFNKRFTFYTVDREAKFYILLKSDITDLLREEKERNELLAGALKEAEHANAAKTTFLSNMSHEIRTPMNAIIGLDSIALSDPNISDETREYLEKIGASAKHLLGLINDILDMSRIESGRMMLRNDEFSLRDMLGQLSTLVQSQCSDKGLKFEMKVTGSVDDYYIGDVMKLKQVCINMLSNAVKFTNAPGSVSFIVEQTAGFEDKSTLRFIVRDTGIGIDKDFIPKIFDTFSQENSGSSNKYGSTGLGMAITKNIVDMMNGNITVNSEKGNGTEFIVAVTLKNSRHSTGENERADDAEKKKREALLAGRNVLMAEDMAINAEIMKKILSMKGINVVHAENGREALRAFSESEEGFFAAVLMDVRMPVMNGLEAAAAIRGLERSDAESVPIIAMTANAFDEDVQLSLQAGMNAHLSKPVEIDQLYETLERMIL